MAHLRLYQGTAKTFKLDPHSYHEALKDPFELKELESYNLIKSHLQEFKRPIVSTSHGKDSLVLVHLIWRVAKELAVPMPDCWLTDTLNTFKEEKPFWDVFNKWLGIEDKFRVFIPPKDENGIQQSVYDID